MRLIAALLLVGCADTPTRPMTLQVVATPEGPVTAYSTNASFAESDVAAIIQETLDGYRDGRLAYGEVPSTSTWTVTANDAAVAPWAEGHYLGYGQILVRSGWRALDHELQHHFCHALGLSGCELAGH